MAGALTRPSVRAITFLKHQPSAQIPWTNTTLGLVRTDPRESQTTRQTESLQSLRFTSLPQRRVFGIRRNFGVELEVLLEGAMAMRS